MLFLLTAEGVAQPIRFYNYGVEQGLATLWADCVVRDHTGYLWIGMTEGLARYDGSRFRFFHHDPTDSTSLRTNRIEALFVDSKGRLWVGTDGAGVHRWNPDSETFTRYYEDSSFITTLPPYLASRSSGQIWCFAETADGCIWVGTSTGLVRLDPSTGSREYFLNPFVEPVADDVWRANGIRSLRPDRFDVNKLWIGTLSGLFEFSMDRKEFIPHLQRKIRPVDYSTTVRTVWQDGQGIIWTGNFSGGVQRFNPRSRDWQVFLYHTDNDSVPEPGLRNIVDVMVPAEDGKLWLSTHDKGIVVFDTASRSFTFPTGMGLPTFCNEAYGDREGQLWVAYPRGVLRVPDVIAPDTAWQPRLVVSDLLIDGRRWLVTGDHLKLPFGTRELAFNYALLTLAQPDMISYSYKLENYDGQWVAADGRTFVQYTNLKGGRYTFRVKAVDHRGQQHETAVPFSIHVPFYRTAWFIALCAGVLIVIIGLAFWLRIRQVRHDERLKASFEKELARVEMEALRSQMNPHFLFNALNSLKDLIIRNEPQRASDYLSRFSRLIRLILENSKEQMVTLDQEIEAVSLYVEVEQHRFENKFDYKLDVQGGLDPKEVMVPPMLIQPYVENAIWHGLMHKPNKGMLQLTLGSHNGSLMCAIEDNGIGRARAAELRSKSAGGKKSYGMAITRDRVALVKELYSIEARVEVEDLMRDGEATGTRVTLRLPLIPSN